MVSIQWTLKFSVQISIVLYTIYRNQAEQATDNFFIELLHVLTKFDCLLVNLSTFFDNSAKQIWCWPSNPAGMNSPHHLEEQVDVNIVNAI